MFSRLARPTAFSVSKIAAKKGVRVTPKLAQFFHAGVVRREEKKDEAAASSFGSIVSDWRFGLPLGMTLAVPALSQKWIVLSEETQLLACFILFSSLLYTQAGGAISKSFEEKTAAIMAEHAAIEDANVAAVKALVDTHKTRQAILEEAKALYAGQSEMVDTLLKAKSAELKHAYRADIQQKLDQLVLMEDAAKADLKSSMAAFATEAVTKKFAEDKKLKTTALDSAINVLGGAKADDPVSDMFSTVVSDFKKHVQSQEGKEITSAELIEMMGDELAALKLRVGAEGFEVDLPEKIKIGGEINASFK